MQYMELYVLNWMDYSKTRVYNINNIRELINRAKIFFQL